MVGDSSGWVGRIFAGRYEIESLLGRGGMSSVYKARDKQLRRPVAIKILHPHLQENAEFLKRFEQEAASVAMLRHPHIVQAFDFNREGDTYYVVLEYVPGETLEQRLATLKEANLRLPLQDAIRILLSVCEAVAYAHAHNVIHRDLKPSNVILNLLGQPVLTDFGIAKILSGGIVHTAMGTTIGTAAYMSPEQVRGTRVDHRSDIYSLGVMFYELVAGEPPFSGRSANTIMQKHLTEPMPDTDLLRSNVPKPLVDVLKKALAKDPDDRHQSASELAADIERVAQGLTSKATAPDYAGEMGAFAQPRQGETRATQRDGEWQAAEKKRSSRRLRRPLYLGALGAALLVLCLAAGALVLLPRLNRALPPSSGMVRIPARVYTVGLASEEQNYAAPQEVSLDEYWIDRFEVTNEQYAAFLSDSGAPAPWPGGAIPAGEENHPVQGVTWEMSRNYCEWADKRLPTEAEWEVAARGPEGWLYPWGNEPDAATVPSGGTYDVGSAGSNRSPFGVADMAGNTWEWVDEPYAAVGAGQRVLRGGAYNFFKDMAYRLVGDPNVPTMYATAGFRCAASEVEIVEDEIVVEQPQDAVGAPPLLADDFTDPNSGWPESREGGILSGYHPPDFYHLQASMANQRGTAFYDRTFDNFILEVSAFVESTETSSGDFYYGLAIRKNEEGFYAFMISARTRRWQVVKYTGEEQELLAEGEDDSIQSMQTADSLRIDARESVFIFHINRRPVVEVHDDDYESGQIGFVVETLDETRPHIHYDDLSVRPLSEVVAAVPTATALPATATTAPPQTASATEPAATPAPETPPPSGRGMVQVAGGTYTVATGTSVTLEPFWIDRHEVTNSQFAEFVDVTGAETPAYWTAEDTLQNAGEHPVRNVTWGVADAYCTWLGKRLPTEVEWEVAARGPHGWLYPWGDEQDAVTLALSGTYAVGTILANRSFFGVFDMAGNVWEWVDEPYMPVPEGQRVLRGGANNFQNEMTYRAVGDPNSNIMFSNAGMRCASSSAAEESDGSILLSDGFYDIESGWWQAAAPVGPYFYGYHPTDFYHVQITAPDDCLAVNHEVELDNFMAEVDVFMAATDTETGNLRYGLTFRQDERAFYAFMISPRQKTWHVFKSVQDGLALMDEGQATSIRGNSQETRDRLFVIANGTELTFFVNGRLVSRIYDADYTRGHLGFIVETLDETYAHIHFDSVTAWQLPPEVTLSTTAGQADYPLQRPVCRGAVSADNHLVNFVAHTVEPGDTLSELSQRFDVTVEAIVGANGQTIENPRLIRVGQTIIIPRPGNP